MPRTARIAPGGVIFHVLNRGVGKLQLFRSRKDHEAFQRCLCQTQQAVPMRVLAYCVMSTHWHLVLWPRNDGDLARFMMRLSIRHVRRWLIHRNQVGTGHVDPISHDGQHRRAATVGQRRHGSVDEAHTVDPQHGLRRTHPAARSGRKHRPDHARHARHTMRG
jgi:REP element-mobilizing transposase RayT